ncbi:MAG: hypothetical protein FJ387_30135 [Verrucomicrobia bacterium]|nr:hypothetical protein [Verrucomicrobiota bacterium]
MKRNLSLTASLFTFMISTLLALGVVAQLQAQEKKVDPTGLWSWSMAGRQGGEPRKITLKLKLEGEKLTGVMTSPGRQGAEPRETPIENGKLKGDELSFTMTREFNNNRFVQKYVGKVAADTIKGKIEFERQGETQSREWEAKRAPAAKP